MNNTGNNWDILADIRLSLTDSMDPKTLASSNRFFKQGEEAKLHGVGMGEAMKKG